MFPHPQDLILAACKVEHDAYLNIVAQTVTLSIPETNDNLQHRAIEICL